MKRNFNACMAFTLHQEGGVSHDPADPGGLTNKGVTQHTYDRYRTYKNAPLQLVTLMTPIELTEIYRQFWTAIDGDKLPKGVDLAVFDYAFNSGPFVARTVLHSLQANITDNAQLIIAICHERLKRYKSFHTWARFGKTWHRRIDECLNEALIMNDSKFHPGDAVIPSDFPDQLPAPVKPSAWQTFLTFLKRLLFFRKSTGGS